MRGLASLLRSFLRHGRAAASRDALAGWAGGQHLCPASPEQGGSGKGSTAGGEEQHGAMDAGIAPGNANGICCEEAVHPDFQQTAHPLAGDRWSVGTRAPSKVAVRAVMAALPLPGMLSHPLPYAPALQAGSQLPQLWGCLWDPHTGSPQGISGCGGEARNVV